MNKLITQLISGNTNTVSVARPSLVRRFRWYGALLLCIAGFAVNAQNVVPYTSSGTFIPPAGVTSVTVECWGGGGGGGGTAVNPSAGGGGAGGAYSMSVVPVTPGTSYTVTVGSGGIAGTGTGGAGGPGGNSWFGSTTTVLANGGFGGLGGTSSLPNGAGGTASSTGSIGTTIYKGGNGAAALSGTRSGPGGGGAGSGANGSNAVNTANAGAAGGTGTNPGGAGGVGRSSANAGGAGVQAGGGGGGGYRTSSTTRAGGVGGAGQVIVTYACPVQSLPYTENFDGVTTPAIPSCTIVKDVNNDGYTWATGTDAYNSSPNSLTYAYNSSSAANDWWFTPGFSLTAGSTYQITFKYAAGLSGYPEALELKTGSSQTAAGMSSTALFSNTNIVNTSFATATINYTATSTGTQYFGWHAISIADEYELYVDDISISLLPPCSGTPTPGTITGSTIFCGGSAASLALSGTSNASGLTYQWQSATALAGPYSNVSTGTGGTTNSYTSAVLTGDVYYQAKVTCTNTGGSTATATPVHVVVNNPQITGSTPGTRCGLGTVSLTATASTGSIINWYSVATAGTSLGTGSSFTTPTINASTTYYAEPSIVTASGNIGQVSDASANLSDDFYDDMYFAATQATTISSVDVYPSTTGTTTISLYDNNFNLIGSRAFTFTAADVSTTVKKTLALNFAIPAGSTGWFLEYDQNLNAGFGTYTYPASTTGFSITGNSYDGDNASTGTMYCFYNWNVTSSCIGARSAVIATVTTAPVITASAIPATVCSGSNTTLAASSANSGYSYSWSGGAGTGAGVAVAPTGTTYPSSTATYTVTGTDNSGGANNGCVATATATVTINPGPAITSITPGLGAMVCGSALQSLTATASNVGSLTKASGTITTTIPDANATGITKTLAVSGVPAGAIIDSVIATVTITHAYAADVQLNLKAPNGQIINLVSGKSVPTTKKNFSSAHFTSDNTKPAVSTNATAAIKGTYKADAVTASSGFELAPTAMPTTANYSDLFTTPNGTWSLNAVDDEAGITGKLKNWSIKIAFHTTPTITWSPLTDLYTDAAGTIAYTGTNTGTVYTAAHNNAKYIATAAISNSCTTTAPDSVQVSSTPANTLAMTTTNANSWMIGFNAADIHTNACELIATVQPSGASPVFGNITSTVTINSTAGNVNNDAYMRRVYYIEPDINAANATATVTLYATQADFDDCNAAALLLDTAHALLPASSTGSTAKVRIMQYHNNGNPGSSPSGSAVITPTSVTWDAANSRWALTFPVTGFSNFYIYASNTASPLPIKLLTLVATNEGAINKIEWHSGVENGLDHYDVTRSRDGITFEKIGEMAAEGNSQDYITYDKTPFTGVNYYRIKSIAVNGDVSYSDVVKAIVNGSDNFVLHASPNPVSDLLSIDVENATTNAHITLTDVTGKVINTTTITDNKATFQMNGLASGIYYIRYSDNTRNQTIKINKQ